MAAKLSFQSNLEVTVLYSPYSELIILEGGCAAMSDIRVIRLYQADTMVEIE